MLAYKLTHEPNTFLEKTFGHNSVAPTDLPNLEVIQAGDFWSRFVSFSPLEYAWGGSSNWNNAWGTLMIFYRPQMDMHGGGFAVWQANAYPRKEPVYLKWSQCAHVWYGRNIGNCLTQYTCLKCKHSYDVDSSG